MALAERTAAPGVELALTPGPVEVVLHDPPTGGVVGRWHFPQGGRRLLIDLLSPEMCRVDGRRAAEEEVEAGFIPWPRLTFVVNGRPHEVVSTDAEVLRRHYARERHQEVSYAVPLPFNTAFHAARIEQARRLLRGVRGRVLDVGSGYSLVGMAGPWEFDLYACDWDRDALRELLRLGRARVARAKAEAVPFAAGGFDAVYAGEIIEHLVERAEALRSWVSLLRPGGRLVLTTPNRRHLWARVTGRERVQNPEHLHEYTVAELRAEVEAAGARIRHLEGLCLPLPIWVPRRGLRDAVHSVFCRYVPNHPVVLRRVVELGRPLPRLAQNLAVVAERVAGPG
jgi:SAM-dependent methyltransferase